ncbi:MAG: hypothetical protein HYU66_24040 [Armatimonadetes bacterium]|nr:hypothetical protein [Armatimonadota bacterium]
MNLWGPGDQAVRNARGRWSVADAAAAPFQLTIADGAYRVPPGSLHRVAIWRGEKGSLLSPAVGVGVTRDTLTAGPDGTLTIRDQAEALRLTLTPVEAQPEPPVASEE